MDNLETVKSCSCGCGGTCKDAHVDSTSEANEEKVVEETTPEVLSDVFKSKSQQGYLETHDPKVAKEFAEHTTKKEYANLPEHVAKLDEVEGEILAPLPSVLKILLIDDLKLNVELPIHDHGDDAKKSDLPMETFDVDKKIFSVWETIDGNNFIIDGHHHYKEAKSATRFVTSKAQKGRLVSAKPEVTCRVYPEEWGWTLPLVKDLSYKMNFEGKKAVTTEVMPFGPGEPIEDEFNLQALIDSGEASINFSDADGEIDAIEDSVRDGVLGVLTQKITRVNKPTKWGFTYAYPGAVGPALDEANERFKLKTIHTEKHHPQLIANACDNNGCGPKFVSNIDNITGTPLSVSKPDKDGWIRGRREIVDTPDGREVWAAAKAGRPLPVSVRWLCDSSAKNTGVPKWLRLLTWDDVRNPAVEGAGALADSAPDDGETHPDGDAMTSWEPENVDVGLGEPFYGINNNTVNPVWPPKDQRQKVHPALDSAQAQGISMKTQQEILADIRAFRQLMRSPGANRSTLSVKDAECVSGILDAFTAGADVRILTQAYKSAFADAAPESAAYHSGTSGPYIQLGNELGSDPMGGWGADVREVPEEHKPGEDKQVQQKTKTMPVPESKSMAKADAKAESNGDDESEDHEDEKEDKKLIKKMIDAKMDEFVVHGHPFSRLPKDVSKSIRSHVRRTATSVDEVSGILDSAVANHASGASYDTLVSKGYGQVGVMGRTINGASPLNVKSEATPGQEGFERLMAATDEFLAMGSVSPSIGGVDPNSPSTKSLRAHNRKLMMPIIDEWQSIHARAIGNDKFYGAITDSADSTESLQKQFQSIALADSYTTAVSQLPNQPTVMKWILTQAFQDQKGLQYCAAFGPGFGSEGGDGWETRRGLGRVFKVFYESYQDPSGYGFEYGNVDFGLLTPENQGITEGSIVGYWDTFFPQFRKNATSDTIEGIKSIGNGPLNLSAVARNLWHVSARKSRTIDLAIMNEMPDVTMEYGTTAVSGETYTTGNHGLPNQSVFPGSGTITVNLNPTKTASTAVTIGTDDYIQYPNPNVPTSGQGLAPIAAMRLLSGTAVGQNAAPYFGTNTFTKNPIVRPRNQLTLTSAGADSTSVLNPISVSAPANMVLGVLGVDGYIYSAPGTTATYAIDYANGVVVFASGVTGAASVLTTTVTLSYTYSTNFDYFPLTPGINGLANLATGETPAQFSNRLLAQFDSTAAKMTSWPRFMAPDLAIMSANVSPAITQATAFYKLNSPLETDLYPSDDFFFSRNGVAGARINTPWWPGDNMIVMTRRRATKYAMDTPWEVRGPNVKYDSSGNFIAGEGYWGAENSAIFTPQVKSGSGQVINPVGRAIMLISGNTPV